MPCSLRRNRERKDKKDFLNLYAINTL
jgi:hypothetical protein